MQWNLMTPGFDFNFSHGNSLHSLQRSNPFTWQQTRISHLSFFGSLESSALHPEQTVEFARSSNPFLKLTMSTFPFY